MFRALKWLYPGMRIKRWLVVVFLGVIVCCLGAASLVFGLLSGEESGRTSSYGYAALFFLLGGFFMVTGVYRLMKSLAELLWRRESEKDLVDVAFERRYLGLGPRVVALGGGTGMSWLLEGLKEYTAQVTAVVSVADDGGSSGRLRREFDMLPPGDIRKCLVALSGDSPMLGELMRYRFSESDAALSSSVTTEPAGNSPRSGGRGGSDLAGHSFGNLFLAVLWRLTGDFAEGVRQAGRILSIRGKVIPATLDRLSLVATCEDGSTTVGQRRISESEKRIRRVELKPKPPPASRDIVDAIARADLIVVGPGSLYTSVLPNLLIEGITAAIRRSDAVKAYVASIVSDEGETRGYGLGDYLTAVREHVGPAPFDIVLVNSREIPEEELRGLARHRPRDGGGGSPAPGARGSEVEAGAEARPGPGERGEAGGGREGPDATAVPVRYSASDIGDGFPDLRFVEADLAASESPWRHDPKRLARTLMTILAEERDRE